MNDPNKLSTEVIQRIQTSSVNLVNLDRNCQPTKGSGSGCLVEYGGKRYLLTVEHVIAQGNPSLVIKWDSRLRKTSTRPLQRHTVAHQGTLPEGATNFDGVELKTIDLAYFEYPYDDVPEFQKLNESGEIIEARTCTVWPETALNGPRPGVKYGFGGHTRPSIESHNLIADDVLFRFTEFRISYALAYQGQEGDFCAFKLAQKHLDHADFKGCSGSPVIDMDGNVVAVISHGNLAKEMVYGVPIEKYKLLLMAEKLVQQFNDSGKPHLG